jgi:hypothetical protein
MTIAIGQQVLNGLIVAADTLVTREDGSATNEPKIVPFLGESGAFVIAVGTEDLEAARTLVTSIRERLVLEKPVNLNDVQGYVSTAMTRWFKAFGVKKAPDTELVLGMWLRNDSPRLIYCSPPITFNERLEGYVAVGSGASVTNPLYDLLLESPSFPRTIQSGLRQTAYLISRAKKENALCGKRTICYVIGSSESEPILVNFLEIAKQEQISGELDFLLHCGAVFALHSDADGLEKNAIGLGDMLRNLASLRATVFHDTFGQEIRL